MKAGKETNNPNAQQSEVSETIPLIQESVEVETEEVETGIVRVSKSTEVKEVPVDLSLSASRAEIKRVPVGKPVEQVYGPRQDGAILIVPIFEEILIKQLVLKEEVHIRVKEETHEVHDSFEVRNEEISIDRYDAITKEWKPESGS